MKEQLISFETAKLAKEKGFGVETPKGYYKHGDVKLLLWIDSENYNDQEDFICLVPTQSLLKKWIEYNNEMFIEVRPIEWFYPKYIYHLFIWIKNTKIQVKVNSQIAVNNEFYNYERALERGLQEALKLIEL